MDTQEKDKNSAYISWGKKYDYEIVGESNYQANLLKIAGNKEEKAKKVDCIATIQREYGNIHDPFAVIFKIDSLTVGYLPKTENKKFIKQIKSLKLSEDVVLVVKAQIIGGWKDRFSEGSFGVRLSFPAEYSRYQYCISTISIADAEKNLNRNPLSKEQLEFFNILELDIPDTLNYFNFTRFKNGLLKKLKQDNLYLYNKWIDHINKPSITLKDVYAFWGDKDERETFWIKKPNKNELTLVINDLLDKNVTLEHMYDNPELVYEELIKINPSLERD